MTWMQVAIKPAKPFAFGLVDGGGGARAGLRPARQPGQLARQLRAVRPPGAAPDDGPPPRSPDRASSAITDADLRRRPDGKIHFLRVNGAFGDDGRYHVVPVGAQGSHQLAATALADALVVRRPTATASPPATEVGTVLLLGRLGVA